MRRSSYGISASCRVPRPDAFTAADTALMDTAKALLPRLRTEYREQAFHRALEATWEVIGAANRYVDEQAPWALRKTDPARMATVLYVTAETVRHLAILTQPVMPGTMGRMLDQLGVAPDQRAFAAHDTPLIAETSLPAPKGVFPRYVEPDESGG